MWSCSISGYLTIIWIWVLQYSSICFQRTLQLYFDDAITHAPQKLVATCTMINLKKIYKNLSHLSFSADSNPMISI